MDSYRSYKISILRPYHSVDQTKFTRCFQNTMYIDIGKYMSIQNTCHNRTIIYIESLFLYSIHIIYYNSITIEHL